MRTLGTVIAGLLFVANVGEVFRLGGYAWPSALAACWLATFLHMRMLPVRKDQP